MIDCISESVNVIPLDILCISGLNSRMSHLIGPPFQLIRLRLFAHPLSLTGPIFPILSTISKVTSVIFDSFLSEAMPPCFNLMQRSRTDKEEMFKMETLYYLASNLLSVNYHRLNNTARLLERWRKRQYALQIG